MSMRSWNVENDRKRDKKTGKFMSENRPKTHVISFRVDEKTYQDYQSKTRGESVGEWIKRQIKLYMTSHYL